MTIQDLFNDIRPKVGDRNGNKYSNQRIIEIINEGLEDMAKKANIKVSTLLMPIAPYQKYITIPDTNFIKLHRVRQNHRDIEKYTHLEIDNRVLRWEEKTGPNIEALVYDLQNPRNFIIYPMLTNASTQWEELNSSDDGTLIVDMLGYQSDESYGLVTSIDIDENLIDLYDKELAGIEPITSIIDMYNIIEFIYYAKPNKLDTSTTDLSTEVDLDDQYRNTLVYYVSGILLLDDNRTESIQRGQIFLQRYGFDIKKDLGRASNSYQGMDFPEIPYRTGF